MIKYKYGFKIIKMRNEFIMGINLIERMNVLEGNEASGVLKIIHRKTYIFVDK